MKKLPNRIRELREAWGMTGGELAELLGISVTYLYDLEKGVRRLNEELILKLCEVFGVSADYILGRPVTPLEEQKVKRIAGRRTLDASKFGDLSPHARETVLQLIDRLYELERGERHKEKGPGQKGGEQGE